MYEWSWDQIEQLIEDIARNYEISSKPPMGRDQTRHECWCEGVAFGLRQALIHTNQKNTASNRNQFRNKCSNFLSAECPNDCSLSPCSKFIER